MGRIYESSEQAIYDELAAIRKLLEKLLAKLESVIH